MREDRSPPPPLEIEEAPLKVEAKSRNIPTPHEMMIHEAPSVDEQSDSQANSYSMSQSSDREKRKVTNKIELEEEIIRTSKKYLKHNIDIMKNAIKLHKIQEHDPSIPLPVPLPRAISFKEKSLFEDLVDVNTITVF
jgi:hypothetical protein